MPTDPAQLTVLFFEIGLLLFGTLLLFSVLLRAPARARWLRTNALPAWPIPVVEFALLAALVLAFGFLASAVTASLVGNLINRSADRDGLSVVVFNGAIYGGSLLGWKIFPWIRRHLYTEYGGEPLPIAAPPPPALSWRRAFVYGGGTLLAAVPLLGAVQLGWINLLHWAGLPEEPQPLLAIFADTRSPAVVAGMIAVACAFGPLYEERMFRGGLYHFCRQHLGRGWALAISGIAFGAAHRNLESFLPLVVLGVMLAVVYEATGSVAVVVIAHALFNLNSLLLLLSGLSDLAS